MPRSAVCTLLLAVIALAGQGAAERKRSFEPKDWAAMRVAHSETVSPDANTVLYEVNHGAEQGQTQSEWWLLSEEGGSRRKLDVPKDFSPVGFTRTGDALYGTWQVGGKNQLAVFDLRGLTSQSVPSTTVLLPRGVKSGHPFARRRAVRDHVRSADPRCSCRASYKR